MRKAAQRFTRYWSVSPVMRYGLASIILIEIILVESFNPSVRVLKRGCQHLYWPEGSSTSLVPSNFVHSRNFQGCSASQQNTIDERTRTSSFSSSLRRNEARCAATHDSNAPNAEDSHPSWKGSQGCRSEGSTAAAESNHKTIGVRSYTSRPCMDKVTSAERRLSKRHRQQKESRQLREKGRGGSRHTGLEEVFVSRRQLLGAVAVMGTAAMLVRSDNVANAVTEVRISLALGVLHPSKPRNRLIVSCYSG